MEFISSSRGSPGPLVSRATGDVLASHFLNRSIIAILLKYAHSLSPFPQKDKGWVLRVERYPPIPLQKGVAGGEPEAGATWAEGPCAGVTGHPRHCHLHGAP